MSTRSSVTSTPAKARQVTGYEAKQKRATDVRIDYSNKMRGHWRGPVNPSKFIDTRFPDVLPSEHESISKVHFGHLHEADNEKDMYNIFIEGLDTVKFPENVDFVVSADKAASSRDLRPDIGMRILLPQVRKPTRKPGSNEGPYDTINTALCIELKYTSSDDPFDDWNPDDPIALFETTSEEASSTRGQLAMYADRQFKHQPRRFLYQVVVFSRYARLIYWDRSAAVVTKAFDIIENPDILAKFLWRFAHATEEERGWDETVTMATRDEKKTFLAAVDQFATNGTANIPPTIAKSMAEKTRDCTYPICKVLVHTEPDLDSDGQPTARQYLVGAPFNATCAIVGRGTRSYIAYDVELKEVFFLKDTWWVSHASTLSEMEAYKMLEDSKSKHVLIPVRGGIVRGTDGEPQVTTCSDFTEEVLAPYDKDFRKFVHGRVVQELACRLDGLKSSRELISVLRDVLECIKNAHNIGLKHRDITFANIMSVTTKDNGVLGILNDWDHVGRTSSTDGGDTHAAFFSTTWQFMGIAPLEGKRIEHRLIHDLESLFWVFVYTALHFCKHDDTIFLNGNDLFDETEEEVTRDCEVLITGGNKKRALLAKDRMLDFPFDCPPLRALVDKLVGHWKQYDQLRGSTFEAADITRFEEYRAQLENPDFWIVILNNALEQPGWLPNDIVPDQCLPRTSGQTSRVAQAAVAARNSTSLKRQQFVTGNSSSMTHLRRKISRVGLKGTTDKQSKRKAEGESDPATSSSSRSQKKKRAV